MSFRSFDTQISEPIRQLELGSADYVIAVFGRTFTGPETAVPAFFLFTLTTGLLLGDSIQETLPNRVGFALISLGITDMFCQTFKRIVKRKRPPVGTVSRCVNLRSHLKPKAEYESFPSGDTAAGSTFAASLAILTGNPFWLLVAAAVGFARVYFHCHFVVDVLAGASLGVLVPVIFNATLSWQWFSVPYAVGVAMAYALYRKFLINRVVRLFVEYEDDNENRRS